MFEVTKVTTAADGTKTYVQENGGIADTLTGVAMAPFDFATDQLVSKQTQAVNVLAWGALLGLLGEAYGHKRERAGSQSFLPIFRG